MDLKDAGLGSSMNWSGNLLDRNSRDDRFGQHEANLLCEPDSAEAWRRIVPGWSCPRRGDRGGRHRPVALRLPPARDHSGDLAARASTDRISEADVRASLQQIDPSWDELFPAEQARIVALLVERVDVGSDGLNVRLRVDGLSGITREMLGDGIGEAA